MKTASGEYLNLYTEVGYEDDTDLDVALDIYVLFAEVYSGDIDMIEMENRARDAISKWKNGVSTRKYAGKPVSNCQISSKIRRVLAKEFEEEAVCISVKNIKYK